MFCRLCLTVPKLGCYLNIFDGENLAEIIAKHFSFEPSIEDTHKIICQTCWYAVDSFHLFYTKIEEAQKHLQPNVIIKVESNLSKDLSDIIKSEIEENQNEQQIIISTLSLDSTEHSVEKHEEDNLNQNNISSESLITKNKRLKRIQTYLESDEGEKPKRSKRKKIIVKKNISKSNITESCSKNYKKNVVVKRNNDDIDKKILDFMKLRCDICLKEEPTFTDIKKHFRSEHNMMGYITCCDKKFNKRVYLSDHVDTHLNPEQFKCHICNRVQANHNSLRQHIKVVHETPRNWECDICKKKMTNRSALELHKYTHIPVEEHSFKCSDCGKTFASEYQMKMHWAKVHESLSNNICYVCGKIIKDMVLFKKHQLEHEGIIEPKAQCEKCGIWLKNILSLRKHVKNLHAEEDIDHICNLCDKICRSKAALKSHKFYVHNTRTYPCTVCGKEFKKTITLKEHMSTHTGEVLYTCPHCPKTFTSNANLHHHRKKNHRKEWEEKRARKMQPPTTNGTNTPVKSPTEFSVKIDEYIETNSLPLMQ